MEFTDKLWQEIEPIYDHILELPFIKELTDGTLSEEVFTFYLKQDTLYLSDYSRALSLAGIRSDSNEQARQFLNFATNAIDVERELHGEFYEKLDAGSPLQKSPSCFAYTNYLLATATMRDNAIAIAALLPCFWIYREVGLHIYEHAALENPYQDWINTYAGEKFNDSVEKAIAITNRVAEEEPNRRRKQMIHAFVRSSQMEWKFWDSAYEMEQWPRQPKNAVPA
ncbi:thiaminase II [Fodinibius saliphilus]|uniref:thiaminase II n=1 Tax=Fodinibius saliphilus TaxID=1920650 RepID=UPI00110886FB|nr:thiaminase II [Fodinibius saliphilus]